MVLQAEKNGSCGLSPISDDEVDKIWVKNLRAEF